MELAPSWKRPQSPLSLLPDEDTENKLAVNEPKSGFSPDTKSASAVLVDF